MGEEWGNIFLSKLFSTKSTELFKKEEVIQLVSLFFIPGIKFKMSIYLLIYQQWSSFQI